MPFFGVSGVIVIMGTQSRGNITIIVSNRDSWHCGCGISGNTPMGRIEWLKKERSLELFWLFTHDPIKVHILDTLFTCNQHIYIPSYVWGKKRKMTTSVVLHCFQILPERKRVHVCHNTHLLLLRWHVSVTLLSCKPGCRLSANLQ